MNAVISQPHVLDPTLSAHQEQLTVYRRQAQVIDTYDQQVVELLELRRHVQPDLATTVPTVTETIGERWVYLPWQQALVRTLPPAEYYELLTSRNAILLPPAQQRSLKGLTIGIVGLSVGSNVARTLVQTGLGQVFKLADPDRVSLSNLNRIQADLRDVGENKALVATRSLYQLNPYLTIEAFDQGLGPWQLRDFFGGQKPLSVIIDECDDLQLKLYLRLIARALQIPLVMVTDNAYSVTCEVYRFDLDKNLGDFKNLPDFRFDDICQAYQSVEPLQMSVAEEDAFIRSLVGEENLQAEMRLAAAERVKGRLSFWPQLGMTALVSGGIAGFLLTTLFTNTTPPLVKSSFAFKSLV